MQTQRWYDRHGDIVHEYTLEPSGRIVRRVISATGAAVLDENQRRRLEPDSVRRPDWGVLALRIPEAHYHVLRSRYPELSCWDHQIRSRAWDKFMQSPESRPYRVKEKI